MKDIRELENQLNISNTEYANASKLDKKSKTEFTTM
jgi:hypothetical protein